MPFPNVLVIHCHDLGTFLNCYGVETVHSPHINKLADDGVRLENCFCSAPSCSPSRASLFTGRYPHSNGVMGLCHAEFAWDLHPGERHLARILKDAGYRTAAVGVVHETAGSPANLGFDEHVTAFPLAEYGHRVVAETTRFLESFAAAPSRPFYLQTGFLEPHRLPWKGEDRDMGFTAGLFEPDAVNGVQIPGFLRDTPGTREELAELQGAVRHLDGLVGQILGAVESLGLFRDTLVVFTTDHGYAMPRAKCSLYDPGMRVAMLLRADWREGWRGGHVLSPLLCNVDFLPTVLDILGLPVPGNVQGHSFAPLLDGEAYTDASAVYGEMTYHDYYDPRRSVRTGTHKLIANFTAAPSFMDPSQSWRPRSDTVTPVNHALSYHEPIELYDLVNDPWEQKNLAGDPAQAELVRNLSRMLYGHMKDTADPLLDGAVTPPMHRKALALLAGA